MCVDSFYNVPSSETLKLEETEPTIYSPYFEKTWTSNHLQMELQRQRILFSYFKTLSAGPVWVSNPPAQQIGAPPT